jgi:hypothetical protein
MLLGNNFKEINFASGILDECVDITYIIYLEGSERIHNINEQLKNFQPTKKVLILYNKGYKFKQNPLINTPPLDLIDCFMTIFKHAKTNNYENILILEDDFIFSNKIQSNKCVDDINHFLKSKHSDNFIYLLGCLPFILIPYDIELKHYRNILSLGAHSIIYSRKMRDDFLSTKNQYNIKDWDEEMLKQTRYSYHQILCYQLFPNTENSKYWLDYFGHTKILKYALEKMKLDRQIEPGYSNCLTFSKTLPISVAALVTMLSLFIIQTRS